MNLSRFLMTAKDTSEHHKTGTRLRKGSLVFVRTLWIVLVGLIVALLIATVPAFGDALHSGCVSGGCHTLVLPYSASELQAVGLSVNFALIYVYGITLFFGLTFLIIGAVIFWLKSYDFMAVYSSFALITFAMSFNNGILMGLVPWLWLPFEIVTFLGSVLFSGFFYLFPNGRFVPRWAPWLVIAWIIYSAIEYFLPNSVLANSLLINFVFVGLLVFSLWAQVYRYRRVSNLTERQQTKWVVYGMAVAASGLVLVTLFYWNNLFSLFYHDPRSDLLADTLINLLMLLIPLSIAFSIFRARLWDIDIIINRTLVYGALTAILALVYAASILLLQYLLRGLIQQDNGVAIVISTLLIAALFQPLRRRLQRIIDRRFYRSKYNASRTLASFSASLRDEVDLATLSEHLLSVVEETMQPAHVSLWLRSTSPDRRSEQTISHHP